MKKFFTYAIAFAALSSVAVACKSDDNNDNNDTSGNLPNGSVLSGEYTSDIRLTANNTYILEGGVHIKPGATIYIEEGVTVTSHPTEPTPAYLAIEPGAKINAVGTASNPIVFTSGMSTPNPQDWGGIILCGKAPINPAGGTANSEMASGVVYGGTASADNSGVMSYVRVEYSGKKASNDKEHNGFTFEGVGSGTTLDHLAVYRGADDAYEFFGGTVNVKYLFAYGAQDDCFDWTYGWTGKAQFLVAVQADDEADRGFECDNNGSNNALTPLSNPTICNVTIIGSKNASTEGSTGKTRAMKLREGTAGKFYNVVAYNFSSGIEVQHDLSLANLESGALMVANSNIHTASTFKYTATDGTSYTPTNAIDAAVNMVTADASGNQPSYLNGYVGTSATNAKDPKSIDAWFDSATYIGAVQSGNDWTQGWTRKD